MHNKTRGNDVNNPIVLEPPGLIQRGRRGVAPLRFECRLAGEKGEFRSISRALGEQEIGPDAAGRNYRQVLPPCLSMKGGRTVLIAEIHVPDDEADEQPHGR